MHETTLYVFALGDPCRALAARILDRIPRPRHTAKGDGGRDARPVTVDALPRGHEQASWTLAVLHCGADPTPLIAWANQLTILQRTRIRFYLNRDNAVPADWPDLVTESPPLVDDNGMIQAVLAQLNDQTYKDKAGRKPPGVP
jgi:hypothetical protein